MRIGLLTAEPDHPLLRGFADVVGVRHRVEVVRPDAGPDLEDAIRRGPAEVYLLKGHSADALRLAGVAESAGAQVVNSATATRFCQDRVRMAERARDRGLPFPHSYSFARLSGLLAYLENAAALRFPLVVKSRLSSRGDLVARVGGLTELRVLAEQWAREPVVVQKVVPSDGWDHKVWVVGSEIFVGLRRTPLEHAATRATLRLDPADLPPEWLDLVRDVGKLYDLQVYGVDIVATARGPMIVDVNAFPGCRGVRGAPETLAALVDGLVPSPAPALVPVPARRRDLPDRRREPRSHPRIGPALLHHAVRHVLGRIDAGSSGVQTPPSADPHPRVVRLRRKRGDGVVAVYRTSSASGPAGDLLTVTLAEQDMIGQRPWDRMSVRTFPADANLPGLAAALEPAGSGLDGELAAAVRAVLGDTDARLVSIDATAVRYKPGSRCVVRYRVRTSPGPAASGDRELVMFGKLYRRGDDAAVAHHRAMQLWDAGAPIPRPIALVAVPAMVLSEAAGGGGAVTAVAGTAALRPGRCDADVTGSAAALAALHTCGFRDGLRERCGSDHTARSQAWAAALVEHVPDLAGEVMPRAQAVATALEHAGGHRPMPSHGAFKPSQLVFCGRGVPVITDLDGLSLADPAFDIGYFLAYLRPSGYWRGRHGRRSWYEHNREVFLDAYVRAAAGGGVGVGNALLARSGVYEAAGLLKIASRRARRLQSPRPAEVEAVLADIDSCLRRFARGGPTAR